MGAEQWTQDHAGNIEAKPVTGWRMALAPSGALVRIEYGELIEGGHLWKESALQLLLSSVQLREFSDALSQVADLVDGQAPSKLAQ